MYHVRGLYRYYNQRRHIDKLELQFAMDVHTIQPASCLAKEICCMPSNESKQRFQADFEVESRFSFDIEDQHFIDSLKTLVKKYKMYMGDAENTRVVSGGLQQYMNKHIESKLTSEAESSPTSTTKIDFCKKCLFQNLPVNVRLHIFSYLSARDLCRIANACRDWYFLSQDNLLWQNLLQRDMHTWKSIGHLTNPFLYSEVQSDWTDKEIYLRCSPEVNKALHQQNAVFNSISSMLRYLLPKKVPKIAMFGPGLESSTSPIVRRILYEENDVFQTVGLFPGQFEGVGGGMTLKMKNGQMFQLSVLYTAGKKERQIANRDRTKGNRLMHSSTDTSSPEKFELMSAVRDLCRTLDAFVFVVDASLENNSDDFGRDELTAMVNERWSSTYVPILVLSCIRDKSHSRIPCINVVKTLQMTKLNRPWQAQSCIAQSLEGVSDGIDWLVEQSQRR